MEMNKRYIFAGVLFAILLSFLVFSFSHTLVRFENGKENAIISVTKDGQEEKSLTLDKGGEKWVLLKNGEYDIFASTPSGNKESLYSYNLRPFSKKIIQISLSPQKQSSLLGKTSFDCFIDGGNQTVFYPCKTYSGTIEVTSAVNETKPVSVGGVQADTAESSVAYAIKPTKDRLISLQLNGNLLDAYEVNPATLAMPHATIDNNFSGSLKNHHLATSPDGPFAIYDSSTRVVLIYQSINDKSPKKISFDKELSKIDKNKFVQIALSERQLYLVVADDPTQSSENTSALQDGATRREASTFGSDLFTVDLSSGKINSFSAPDNIVVSDLSVMTSGRLVLFSQYPDTVNLYEFYNEEFHQIEVPGDTNYACAAGNHIYFNTPQNKIYRYSDDGPVSILAYDNRAGDVSDLNCINSSTVFGITSRDNSEENTLRYTLLDREQSGPRIDGFLPLYHTFNGDSYVATQTKSGVLISLEYDSNHNGPSTKEAIKAEILKELKQQTKFAQEPSVQFSF